ncbi:major facilitator superfamily domain-containing protein [Fennellomyces sp. T-0311]|nr:major facilitator superfamily domain-containing protein [Fennellomyces sp. T-0311]
MSERYENSTNGAIYTAGHDEKTLDSEFAAGTEDKVLAGSRSPEVKKLVRKIDWHLMPIIAALQVMSIYELSVITNARLGGLVEDLNMTEGQYRWCLSIYYFGFVLFEIPSNIIIRRWKPSKYLALLAFSWGTIVMATAGATSFAGLLVSRFLLGVMEAGYLPGITYYISIWYTRKENAERSGYPMILGNLAGATGGLLAYGISNISTHRLNTWQWMFIIEGVPCIVLAVICYFFLPDSPETARFLNEKERVLQINRMAMDQGAADDHSWSWNQVISVFTDLKAYLYTINMMFSTISSVGVSLVLPSIIAGLGEWSNSVSLALTTPPYVAACFFVYIGCWSSDRNFERGYHAIIGSLIRMAGLLMLMFVPYDLPGVRYFGVFLAVGPSYMILAIKMAWYNNNFSGLTRRAIAGAFIQGFGSIGSAVSGQVYYDGPRFFNGHLIGVVFLAAQMIAVLILRIMLARWNKQRENMTMEEREKQIAKYGGSELAGDRHPDFRYAL